MQSTVAYGYAVQCGAVKWNTRICSAVPCSAIYGCPMQCGAVQCSLYMRSAVQCNANQYTCSVEGSAVNDASGSVGSCRCRSREVTSFVQAETHSTDFYKHWAIIDQQTMNPHS